jgi:hypothetical protein
MRVHPVEHDVMHVQRPGHHQVEPRVVGKAAQRTGGEQQQRESVDRRAREQCLEQVGRSAHPRSFLARVVRGDPQILHTVERRDPYEGVSGDSRSERPHVLRRDPDAAQDRGGEPERLGRHERQRREHVAKRAQLEQAHDALCDHPYVGNRHPHHGRALHRARNSDRQESVDGSGRPQGGVLRRSRLVAVQGQDPQHVGEQEGRVDVAFQCRRHLEAAAAQEDQRDAVVLPREVPGHDGQVERDQNRPDDVHVQPDQEGRGDHERPPHREQVIGAPALRGLVDAQERRAEVRRRERQRDQRQEHGGYAGARERQRREQRHIEQAGA